MPVSPNNLSDAEIIRAVEAGDGQAFGTLVDRYLSAVHGVTSRIVCNAATADDLTQETFVRAFQRLHLYDHERPFRNWLLRIATNVSLNHLRSLKRERVFQLRMARSVQEGSVDAPPQEAPVAFSDWNHWLGQIDESQRTAIVLFHFHDLPYAEIADVLDIPINTVRTLLHRGRQRLRELMSSGHDRENGSWNVAIQNG